MNPYGAETARDQPSERRRDETDRERHSERGSLRHRQGGELAADRNAGVPAGWLCGVPPPRAETARDQPSERRRDESMNPYGDVVREHSRHPRNYGALDAPDVRHEDVNPFCGDRVRIELAIVNDTVSEARFQGDLCVIAKAASSLLTEMIVGMSVERAGALPAEQLFAALQADIPPARRRCVELPLEVLRAGIDRRSG